MRQKNKENGEEQAGADKIPGTRQERQRQKYKAESKYEVYNSKIGTEARLTHKKIGDVNMILQQKQETDKKPATQGH